ncbi:SMI1/KNR4 family protein [Burkholderia stagnalis]
MQSVKRSAHEATYPHAGSVEQFEKHLGEGVKAAEKKVWIKDRRPGGCACRSETMQSNEFMNCAAKINESDFDKVEKELGFKLPVVFRDHYLANNGGNPSDTFFICGDGEENFEVVGFYPIKYNTSAYETKDSLLVEHYEAMLGRGVIPVNLLPFAHDPGGNFFCINMKSGTVVFYAIDAFDPSASPQENHLENQAELTNSFDIFMQHLSHDSSLDSGEWPE